MYKDYLIIFENNTHDEIIISINEQDKVNRPNNEDDEDIVNSYVRHNYGNIEYEVYHLSDIERVSLK